MTASDPFLIRVPDSLVQDPESKDYFDFLGKVLYDLTATPGDVISDVPTTTITTLNEVIARLALLETAVNAILAQKRLDRDIKTG